MNATLPEEPTPKRYSASTLNDAPPDETFPHAKPDPKEPHLMTPAEKEAELEMLAGEIWTEKWGMDENENKICGILYDSIYKAKAIGDRLRRAKELLGHGPYQPWVKAKT